MSKDVSHLGFALFDSPDGFRVEYIMPEALDGKISASIVARGSVMDGTDGIPTRIADRMNIKYGELVAPLQVHGTAISECRPIWALPQRVNADGLHLDPLFDPRGELIGSLRFADCVPILIVGHRPHAWAIALHSGFKGTLQGIFNSAWQRIGHFYGKLEAKDISVWIGPSIASCCYTRRVSDDLAQRAAREWGSEFCRIDGDSVRLDLKGVIKKQALESGIPSDNIYVLNSCTACNSNKFYSYRIGDIYDRMTLFIKLKPLIQI